LLLTAAVHHRRLPPAPSRRPRDRPRSTATLAAPTRHTTIRSLGDGTCLSEGRAGDPCRAGDLAVSERPNRDTPAGCAYLDLQNLARKQGRPTDELHQLYALEVFLTRLIASPHANNGYRDLTAAVRPTATAPATPTRQEIRPHGPDF